LGEGLSMTKTVTAARASKQSPRNSSLFSALIGLTALAVLLQGLWAGIFLQHDGHRDDAAEWIDVHAHGGEVAIGLAVAATVVGLVWLRARWDLWGGSALLAVLLVVEAYLGGLIRDDDKDALTTVHVPLAMLIMALAVWLPVRSRRHLNGAGAV
jgi:hypothetical protein